MIQQLTSPSIVILNLFQDPFLRPRSSDRSGAAFAASVVAAPQQKLGLLARWTLKQVQGDEVERAI